MPKMYKLLENELDYTYAYISQVKTSLKNIESIAEYIIEYDAKSKYTKNELEIINKIPELAFRINMRMDCELEEIQKIKHKIVDDIV